jgi:hypothetical protein
MNLLRAPKAESARHGRIERRGADPEQLLEPRTLDRRAPPQPPDGVATNGAEVAIITADHIDRDKQACTAHNSPFWLDVTAKPQAAPKRIRTAYGSGATA